MTLAEAIEEALDDLLCGPESDLDHEALAVELADTARKWFAKERAASRWNPEPLSQGWSPAGTFTRDASPISPEASEATP